MFSPTSCLASREESLRLEIKQSCYSIYAPCTSKTPSHDADAERRLLDSNACLVALGDPRLLSNASRRHGYIRAHRHLFPLVLQWRPNKSLSTPPSQCVSLPASSSSSLSFSLSLPCPPALKMSSQRLYLISTELRWSSQMPQTSYRVLLTLMWPHKLKWVSSSSRSGPYYQFSCLSMCREY